MKSQKKMVYSFHVCNEPGKENRVSDKLKPEIINV